jgi:N-acetyl sugar amidotransferase
MLMVDILQNNYFKNDEIFWCSNCINMSTRPRITFNSNGICNACEWAKEKKELDWDKRLKIFKNEILKTKKKDNYYDCLVPCSGGKDGTYVAYKLKEEYGLNVLTVTARPPLETTVGKKNLDNFIQSGFDHIHVTPNYEAMRKFNKAGLILKGSPYYGWLIAMFAVVTKIAVQNKIKLIFYGEDGEIEYGGSTKNKNQPFFDIDYIINNYFEGDYNEISKNLDLNVSQLYWFNLDKKDFLNNELKFTHWSFFEPWDSYRNYLLSKEKLNFNESEEANMGTFTNFAQNDQILFTLHMYLMYLKFGFGRATQDCGIEIRRGAMTREQAINLANIYDNFYPENYIETYLDYYRMTLKEFNEVLDKWANKKLFSKINNRWTPKFKII